MYDIIDIYIYRDSRISRLYNIIENNIRYASYTILYPPSINSHLLLLLIIVVIVVVVVLVDLTR